jgi:DNA-directed RNA polymerase specialized sigma24 family protein
MTARTTDTNTPNPDWIDAYALARVDFQVGRLSRELRLCEADEDDVRQDLLLDLWKAAHRFDPAIASKRTFICRVLVRAAARVRRDLRSKRSAGAPERLALSQIKRHGRDRAVGIVARDFTRDLDLAMDVEAGVALLGRDQRILVERLKSHTPADIAADTGCHRSTVYRHIEALRPEVPGLESLLES